MKKKLEYNKPKVAIFEEEIQNGVPGALTGAIWMIARALVKTVKGGIDLTSGIDKPRTLQVKR